MRRVRVIPVLTVDNNKLIKTVRFRKPNYIGDPINAIKIFNDKEVDEIIVLDITASKQGKKVNFELIKEMAGECFMPLGYGGGITDFESAKKVFDLGVEKVIVNTVLRSDLKLVRELVDHYGSQSVVISLDINKTLFGKQIPYFKSGTVKGKLLIEQFVKEVEKAGAGEIIINNIEREGTFLGYDLNLIKIVSDAVTIPVVACGGANNQEEFIKAVKAGASAVAASSMFVYKSNDTKSILINYPGQDDLLENLYSRID